MQRFGGSAFSEADRGDRGMSQSLLMSWANLPFGVPAPSASVANSTPAPNRLEHGRDVRLFHLGIISRRKVAG